MLAVPLVTAARTGLVDQVISQMRELVSSGEWPVGRRIPTEGALVTALGVGRNTVREAVRALSHAGLLEVRQGDGTFVRATSELSGAVRRLCGRELRQTLEVRRALEVEGARLAATRCTPKDLRDLEEALRACNAAIDARDLTAVVSTDAAFHARLVEASRNPVLIELYRGISEAVRSSVATIFDPEKLVKHTDLLAAVRAGDPDRSAEQAGGFLDDLLADLDGQSAGSAPAKLSAR
jgi:DNA-binding FadR family transcriptional regulator